MAYVQDIENSDTRLIWRLVGFRNRPDIRRLGFETGREPERLTMLVVAGANKYVLFIYLKTQLVETKFLACDPHKPVHNLKVFGTGTDIHFINYVLFR